MSCHVCAVLAALAHAAPRALHIPSSRLLLSSTSTGACTPLRTVPGLVGSDEVFVCFFLRPASSPVQWHSAPAPSSLGTPPASAPPHLHAAGWLALLAFQGHWTWTWTGRPAVTLPKVWASPCIPQCCLLKKKMLERMASLMTKDSTVKFMSTQLP